MVVIDPDLRELVPGFLAHRREDVDVIMSGAQSGDYDSILHLAHRIKGDGGGYGFEAISDFGRQLEEAAKARNPTAIVTTAQDLLHYLDNLKVVYRSSRR